MHPLMNFAMISKVSSWFSVSNEQGEQDGGQYGGQDVGQDAGRMGDKMGEGRSTSCDLLRFSIFMKI